MKAKNISGTVQFIKIDGVFSEVLPGNSIDIPEGSIETFKSLKEFELDQNESVVEEDFDDEEEDEFKSEEELKKMTKDELNDYAADIGLNEVNSGMLKAEMIEAIIDYQEEISNE